MKIGIFLGYEPQVTLGKEGLGRYIGGLLKGFQDLDHELTVACPHWTIKTLKSLAKEFLIDVDRVNFITEKNAPPMWKVYQFLTQPRRSVDRSFIKRSIKKRLDIAGEHLAKASNLGTFLLWVCFYALLCLVLTLPALLVLVVLVIKKSVQFIANKFGNIPKKLGDRIIKRLERYMMPQLFHQMHEGVMERLLQRINNGPPFDVWFVPSIFWPQVSSIQNGTVVINAPDLLTQEFPFGFADIYNAPQMMKSLRKTLEEGTYFITYCEFLRKTLLLEQYGKEARNTKAIPHVNNAMDRYLYIEPSLKEQNNISGSLSDKFARMLVGLTVQKVARLPHAGHIQHYIFYSSQIRYSKNILNLIKAYEYLLRKKFVHFQLVLTANLSHHAEVEEYVLEHRLENEVICCFNVPAQTLAALYSCADLVVNPTLYEGGFPFTFGEGMSVGTPSIMSDIPQVRDVLEPAGLEEIMFDPYDWKAIADKIMWALEHRDELYEKELPLYQQMEKRTSKVVAAEYIQTFETFIALDQAARGKSGV